jgi:hypothetical protein
MVEGIRYIFLPDFQCFLINSSTALPPDKKAFFGKFEKGEYAVPTFQLSEMKTLTAASVPGKVFEGLIGEIQKSSR